MVEDVGDPVEENRRDLDVVPDIEEEHKRAGHEEDEDGEGDEAPHAQPVGLDLERGKGDEQVYMTSEISCTADPKAAIVR